MAAKSNIEWTDATWPIVQGCDPVSPGCENCYAINVVHRLAWNRNPKISAPIKGCVEYHENRKGDGRLRFTGKVALREDRIDWPLKWKRPRMIFVPSHGDIFHKDVPDSFLDKIFAVMALCPQHTFQVLTKRPERMREYCDKWGKQADIFENPLNAKAGYQTVPWPLPNVWLGVSCERQQEADERIPLLLQTPAAVRFISAEPLLGPIDLTTIKFDRVYGTGLLNALTGEKRGHVPNSPLGGGEHLDWVIVGGESGPRARPMHPDWARSIERQCEAASVAFFFKQWGEYAPSSMSEWVDDDGSHRHLLIAPDGRCGDTVADAVTQPKGTAWMRRVGKKAAGRLLDGREHNEFPQARWNVDRTGGTDAQPPLMNQT